MRSRKGQEGFTLVELLVVLGIIATLAALIAPQVLRYLGKARADTAAVQMKNIESAIELYYLDVGSYPSESEGLEVLVSKPSSAAAWGGPYIKQRSGIVDPWGKPYLYKSPGEKGAYEISSLGRDGREGGESEDADIRNW